MSGKEKERNSKAVRQGTAQEKVGSNNTTDNQKNVERLNDQEHREYVEKKETEIYTSSTLL